MGLLGLQRGALRVKIIEARKKHARKKKLKEKSKKGEVDIGNLIDFSGSGKWRYKTVVLSGASSLDKKLNEFGDNGWELVSATPQRGSKLKCIFKKQA